MFDSLIIRRQPQKMTIFKRGVVGILFVRSFMPLLFFPGNGVSLINDGHFMPFGVRGKEKKTFEENSRKIELRTYGVCCTLCKSKQMLR